MLDPISSTAKEVLEKIKNTQKKEQQEKNESTSNLKKAKDVLTFIREFKGY